MSKTKYTLVLAACALLAVGALIGAVHEMDVLHQAVVGGGVSVAMAVVVGYGSGARDPLSLKAIDGINAAAEIRQINSLLVITSGDSIASSYMIGEVPADAILDATDSLITFDAITSVTDADIGVHYPNGGAVILADCIVNGHDIHTAGNTSLAAATGSGVATAANKAKRVWQLAGLAANPGGNLALWLTINVAATATGNVKAEIEYSKGA